MSVNKIIKLKVKHFKRNKYHVAKLLGHPVLLPALPVSGVGVYCVVREWSQIADSI